MSGWSFRKIALGGALIGAGAFTMFEYLIMDKTVFSELDDSDAAFIGYITMFSKNYLTLEEYKKRKAIFDMNVKLITNQSLLEQDYIMGLNPMSDWTMEEYFSTLGLIPDGQYPQEIIDDDDTSWKDLDNEEEYYDSFLPRELNNIGKDRPKDNFDTPVYMSSLLWGGGSKNKTIDDPNFDKIFEEEEKEFERQYNEVPESE
jgi:hypothetical protein